MGATTSTTQTATVVQNSGSGSNTVSLTQASGEAMVSGSSSIGTWSQSASQSLNIDQNSVSGANSVDAWQLVGQAQTALKATAGSQSQTSDQQSDDRPVQQRRCLGQGQADRGPAAGGEDHGRDPDAGRPAAVLLLADRQPGHHHGDTAGDPDPEAGQQPGPAAARSAYTSTGTITGTQTATQDGTTSTNTFSGSTIDETQACEDGECEIGEPEPPPPPANWLSFGWTGGDGTTADRQPVRAHRARGRSSSASPMRSAGRPLHAVGQRDDARDDVGRSGRTRVVPGPTSPIRRSHSPIRRTATGRSRSPRARTRSTSSSRRRRSVGRRVLQRRPDDAGALHRRQVGNVYLADVRERGRLPRVRRELS